MNTFKKVEEFQNYEVNKDGVIRRISNKRVLSQYVSSTGYYMVSFSKNNKSHPRRVHRVLMLTFRGNANAHKDVNHKDGNKLNNDLSNLEWCNHKQNMEHGYRTGLINNTGEKNGMSKLKKEEVVIIKKLLSQKVSQYKIAERFGVSRSAILKIHMGFTWVHV